MASKTINPLQGSFDFVFDTEEEKQVAQHNQTIEAIVDELIAAPAAEIIEVDTITSQYQPIIPENDINDVTFSASQWIKDNLTAIEIAMLKLILLPMMKSNYCFAIMDGVDYHKYLMSVNIQLDNLLKQEQNLKHY